MLNIELKKKKEKDARRLRRRRKKLNDEVSVLKNFTEKSKVYDIDKKLNKKLFMEGVSEEDIKSKEGKKIVSMCVEINTHKLNLIDKNIIKLKNKIKKTKNKLNKNILINKIKKLENDQTKIISDFKKCNIDIKKRRRRFYFLK